MKYQKSQIILIGIIGTLFLTLYCILSFNNRLPYEDYTFTSMAKESGVINAMMYIYKIYSARWSAHTMGFYFSQYYTNKIFLPCFNIITLISLVASFFLILKRILKEILKVKIKNTLLFIYSLLFTCSLFFSSYNIGESWFWYMVNWMYLWSLIAGNFLLWILFSEKLKAIQILFLLILTAYIAGAAESFAMIYLIFLLFIFFLKRKNIFPLITNKLQNNSLVLSILCFISFYMITILAPGTWARKSVLTQASFIEHVVMVVKGFGIVTLKYTPQLLPCLILFGFPWVILGRIYSSENKLMPKQILTSFLKSIFIICIIIFILIIPASWILYDPPPARALLQISLILCSYSAFIFLYLGYKISLSEAVSKYVPFVSLFICIGILIFQIVNQFPITRVYAEEYDKRIEILNQQNKTARNTTYFFDHLRQSGMLYSDEISTDSTHNNYFEKAYNLKFHVALK